MNDSTLEAPTPAPQAPQKPNAGQPNAAEPPPIEPPPIDLAPVEPTPGETFLLEAFDPATRTDPYPLYARMRSAHPVLHGGSGLWFTFEHAAMNTLLRARGTSSNEQLTTEFQRNVANDERLRKFAAEEPLMLFMDPPDHTRLRSLVSRAFTPRTVERMRPRLEELAEQMIAEVRGAGTIDAITQFAYPFPLTVICELLGIPPSDADTFQSMSDDLTLMIEPGILRTPEQEEAIDRARTDLTDYIGELLTQRRKQPGDDLISALLAARDGDDRLSESELTDMVILLLLAGHETTVNLIGNGLVALLRNPDQLDLWRKNPDLGTGAVDELVRYDSPVQMAMRVLLEPTNVGGVEIPAGEQVCCILGAANRDPLVFDDPNRLDLTRTNAAANLSFGGGIHLCLGMALARTEASILLGELVRSLSHIELVEEPTVRPRFILRGYEQILIEAR